ncbi:MAG: hypothetical protein J3K34DRAFT_416862 [Monoraphidium minutum]|nr:MAG: hypothetical protein J3K34DRAFT_416862 [Monoraphidium minutum]
MTAFLYSMLTWITTFSRSAGSAVQAAVLLVYLPLFFAPYVLMLAARPRFLRRREALMTAARVLSSTWVGACGLLLVGDALPASWATAVQRPLVVAASHGVILPACQQLRLRYALVIAAAHLFGDFGLLASALPARKAFAWSAGIQAAALIITALLEMRSRRAFLGRYQVVLRAPPPAWRPPQRCTPRRTERRRGARRRQPQAARGPRPAAPGGAGPWQAPPRLLGDCSTCSKLRACTGARRPFPPPCS